VQKYYDDPAFLEYLKYLEYWRRPAYVRFIV
jgi:mediator of RNA polymerase II transcription subunit 31